MSDQALYEVQQLQFVDPARANLRLRDLLSAMLPFRVASVQVRPLAVSLNSINGFLTAEDGRRLFFKTHVEPQSVINEYYNAQIMAEAGYPVIRPIHSITEYGKQLLVYEVIENPSLFDAARDIETGRRGGAERVLAIQEAADRQLLDLYRRTLQPLPAAEHARSPVHQLFYHRLAGGRLDTFYRGKELTLPGVRTNYDRLETLHWTINGVPYAVTLGDLTRRALTVLDPAADTPSVVGHGDAHNGNVFLDEARGTLTYFDPAFAGRHSPFLDLTKPLFHNVFAIWLYFPREVAADMTMRVALDGETISVEHDFAPSPLRVGFFYSKTRLVLQPLLHDLRARGLLPPEWRTYLKLALMCCPLLTMNLGDPEKFPPPVTLLGLAWSVVMGSTGTNGPVGLLDEELERIARDLEGGAR